MKNIFINVSVSLVTTVLCVVFLGLFATRLIKNQENMMIGKVEDIITDLEWDNKDIKDIPFQRSSIWNPNIIGTDKTYIAKINSQGLRDYEYGLKKPENSIRIAAVGDSTTFGSGVNLQDTYVKQLEKILNKNCSKKVEVINFGAGGFSTIDELELIQRKILLYRPDIIMLQMDSNDALVIRQIKKVDQFLNWAILKLKNSNFEIGRWLKQKLESYLYYKYRMLQTTETLYNNIAKPLDVIINISNKNNIKLVIISWNGPGHSDYYLNVLQHIRESNIPLLDISTRENKFGRLSEEEKYVNPKLDKSGFPMDPHPNKYSGQLMAEDISKFLESLDELGFKKLCH